ncbi:general odorant-binding protein 45-like [Malaya genurostris]|uniref:general odorant-binding protein 45-like n=1 Tax=Malaya genurostris TaxID=325434 RepID=UPI0026F409C4|nr:general odorant-binding protein 45-like [Malaya genurostris]
MWWILSVFLLLTIVTIGDANHQAVLKSLHHAGKECNQYLDQPDYVNDPCQERCQLMVLRSWNDSTDVIGIPLARHYSVRDYGNVKRTVDCVELKLRNIPSYDVCKRASLSADCFRQNYGSALQTPQLAPQSKLQRQNTVLECARILQIEPGELSTYASSDFLFNQKARCLIRCVIIRQGLYDDVRGPDLDRMYVQCGGYDSPEEVFKRDAQQCIDRLKSECMDNCTLAARITRECFPQNSGPNSDTQDMITGLLSGVPGVGIIIDALFSSKSPLDAVGSVPELPIGKGAANEMTKKLGIKVK